ncbi:MAG: ribosomal RNA small subunit methyltransferase A [Desulfobulbus propionicus]|nr:MAG: ribosomal RNA small subunit methyltransferase A [Desulfobulbus propionicus]
MVYQQTRTLLKKEKLAPKKKLGQNFLLHEHTARRIADVAGIKPTDTIVEIGVGLGALTRPLAVMADRVIGIEADSGIVRMHQEKGNLPDNVILRHGDILKTDLTALSEETGGKLKITANLPYSISTPFLFYLIDHFQVIRSAVIMLQKEVARRLLAKPGTREYGIPTVMLASCASTELLLHIPPTEFHPQPKVDSTVIGITFEPMPDHVRRLGTFDRRILAKVVNAAFGQRRKTLLNSISSVLTQLNKKQLTVLLEQCGIPPSIRAEKLELEDFIRITKKLQAGTNNA